MKVFTRPVGPSCCTNNDNQKQEQEKIPYSSYKIPFFLERLLINPKQSFDEIKKKLKKLKKLEKRKRNEKQRKTEDLLLLQIVISSFACLEHSQHFVRMGLQENIVKLFKYYAEEFENLAIEVQTFEIKL